MALRFSPPGGASALALKSLVRGPGGITGTAATITAGTTTTAAEGSSAAVNNSGSSSAAVFDFTIPRGAAPAVGYTFSTTTTDSDPGNGIVQFNNATPASVTTIYFDNLDADGNTVTTWLDTFDDSSNTAHKGFLTFTDVASPSTKIGFDVTGSSVADGTGYRKVTVTHSFGTTLFTNAHRLAVTFARTGNKGTDGAGTGDVVGPAASVASEIALFDLTTGKLIKRATGSGLVAANSGVYTGPRTITGPAAGISVSNGDGVSGNPTLALANDLSAVEGLSSNGMAARTATDTWTVRTITGTSNKITVTNGDGVSGNPTLTVGGDVLQKNVTAAVSVGYTLTPYSQSWASNFTVDPSQGNYQYATNDAARTITAPASDCAVDILITNHASTAGSITFSGFTVGSSTGSTYATTGNNKYLLSIRRINSVATYSWYALQ